MNPIIIRQHNYSGCGPTCILSLISYYGGEASLERIRELSGTSKKGTTLLGLYQAANALGFNAQGCDADMQSLIAHGKPLILHVLLEGKLEHYVVCYEYNNGVFTIGDPGQGIITMSQIELERIWLTKTCLTLEPNEHFKLAKTIRKRKLNLILELVKPDVQILIVSALIGIAISVLGLSLAIFSQKLIDVIIPSGNAKKLILSIAILGFLLLIKAGLTAVRQKLLLEQGRSFNNRIIQRFLDKLYILPKFFFDGRRIGDIVARLHDTRRVQSVIAQILGSLIIDVLVAISSIIGLFYYSFYSGIVAIIATPIYFLIIFTRNNRIISTQKGVMVGYAATESSFIQSVNGIAAIKSLNKEEQFAKSNQSIYKNFQDRVFDLGNLNITLGLQAGIFGVMLMISILSIGAHEVISGSIKVGALMALLGIGGSLLPSVASLAMVAIPFNEAKVAFERMFEMVGLESEDNCGTTPIETINRIDVHDLLFRFPGHKPLLKSINLSLKQGKITALMGESGCGKSTFCQILEQFYTFEKGCILVNCQIEMTSIPLKVWRSKVASVPQDITIFDGTVLDNICLDSDPNNREECTLYLRNIGLESLFLKFPNGYMTIVGESGINLSGGQKQLVAIARSLYKKPHLLILDESTSAMDKKTEAIVLEVLKQLSPNLLMVFCTHRSQSLIDFADEVLILDSGKLHMQIYEQSL